MITSVGVSEVIDWLAGNTATAPTHIGMGTSNTKPTTGDTALASEVSPRIAFDVVKTLPSANKNAVKFIIQISTSQLNGSVLKEMGLFNGASGGDCLARATFVDIDKDATIDLEVEFEVQLVIL
mgnify:CR=1 FL=1